MYWKWKRIENESNKKSPGLKKKSSSLNRLDLHSTITISSTICLLMKGLCIEVISFVSIWATPKGKERMQPQCAMAKIGICSGMLEEKKMVKICKRGVKISTSIVNLNATKEKMYYRKETIYIDQQQESCVNRCF